MLRWDLLPVRIPSGILSQWRALWAAEKTEIQSNWQPTSSPLAGDAATPTQLVKGCLWRSPLQWGIPLETLFGVPSPCFWCLEEECGCLHLEQCFMSHWGSKWKWNAGCVSSALLQPGRSALSFGLMVIHKSIGVTSGSWAVFWSIESFYSFSSKTSCCFVWLELADKLFILGRWKGYLSIWRSSAWVLISSCSIEQSR